MRTNHTRRALAGIGPAALGLTIAIGGCSSSEPEEVKCDPAPGQICTVAGTGIAGFSGDLGPARKADIYLPMDTTEGPDGDLYIVDWNNHRIRALSKKDGTMRTVAGSGRLGDGPPGKALESAFNHPTNVVFDSLGRMIIAAWHNSRIKRLDLATGMIEDICGTGKRAYSGDEGPAKTADMDLPAAIALDTGGNMFVMDQANQVIRKIDPSGTTITRVAGSCVIGACTEGTAPGTCRDSNKQSCELATDAASCAKACPGGFGGDGLAATAARISQPFGQAADPAGRLGFDASGNLYFADTRNNRVRRIDTAGIITTVAGNGTAGSKGDGGKATDAELNGPVDVIPAPDGTLFIADTMNSCIRAVGTDGTIRTVAGVCGKRGFAGDGGPANAALLDRPYGIELTKEGALYVADTHNHRIRLVRL